MKNISKVKTKCILRNRPKFMTFKRTFYMIYAKYNVTSRRMREITCRKYPERNFFVVCVYLQIKMKREKQQKQFPAFQTNHTTYDNLKNKITHTEILANFFDEDAHISFAIHLQRLNQKLNLGSMLLYQYFLFLLCTFKK